MRHSENAPSSCNNPPPRTSAWWHSATRQPRDRRPGCPVEEGLVEAKGIVVGHEQGHRGLVIDHVGLQPFGLRDVGRIGDGAVERTEGGQGCGSRASTCRNSTSRPSSAALARAWLRASGENQWPPPSNRGVRASGRGPCSRSPSPHRAPGWGDAQPDGRPRICRPNQPTTSSVSGRGMSTSPAHPMRRPRNSVHPSTRCTGSPLRTRSR